MINISKYICPELIITDLKAKTKEDAVRLLVRRLYEVKSDIISVSEQETANEILRREELHTTGLGQQVAFPHARIESWGELQIVIGITREPIDFHSLDGLPVHFICLMISSSKDPYIILQSMASIVHFVNSIDPSQITFEGMNSAEVAEKLKSYELRSDKVIKAVDIMRPIKISAVLDTSLEEISRNMHLHQADVIPVVDDKNNLCGQISCFDIFSYGIPDFFKNLNTVSFVRNLDPFEKYFRFEKELTAKDVIDKKCATIDTDATLVEIIFELTIKNKLKLFVVKDGVLEGEIDRFSIIDKVLFF